MRLILLVAAASLLSVSAFAQPVINSFSPVSGPVGTTVTITGNNFSLTPSGNIVYFGATKATVSAGTAASLTVTVPAGATYQPITITVNGLTAYSARPFLVTFPGGKPIYQNIDMTQNSFEREIDSLTDLHPNGVAIADLDGDGRPDIATANNYSTSGQPASVSVLRNTGSSGSISFAPRMDLPTGVLTYAIAAGDLDGDGKPDLVSSSVVDNTISVFKNTSVPGAISFAPKKDYPTGIDPFCIAIADVDLDGKPDLLVTNYISGTLSVFRNTSTGGVLSFADKIDISTGPTPDFVVAGDLDGDNKPDLVVGAELANGISSFRNTSTPGTISFSNRTDIHTTGNVGGMALGDLDGDGKTDLVIANKNTNSYSVLRNISSTGAISFAAKLDFPCGADPYSISIGDMNGDGKPDIVVPSYNLSVSQNNSMAGNMSFIGPTFLFPHFDSYIVGIGDLDGDGKADMVGAGFSTDRIALIRNKNNEPTIRAFTPTDAVAGTTVTITGYDLDGVTAVSFGGVPATSFTIVNPDTITAVTGPGASGSVAVTNQYGTNRLDGFIFHSPPVIGSFTPVNAGTGDTIYITGNYFTDVSAVDLGGTPAAYFRVNSLTSIAAVVGSGSSGSIRVTNPYGTGSLPGFVYFPAPVITSFTPGGGGIATVISITGTFFSGATEVSIGGVPAASFTINSPTSITAVVAEGADGSITVRTPGGKAISATPFAFPLPVLTNISPAAAPVGSSITITGMNFRSNPSADCVYFGAVRGQVTAASLTSLTVTVPPGATYYPVTLTVNNHTVSGDQPFVATFLPGSTEISDSSFKWRAAFSTSEDPRKIFLSDLDGDGKPDIITQNYFSGTVSILRNTSGLNSFSFVREQDLFSPVGTNVGLAMAIGDVNGDGKPDIIISNWYNLVSVFRNTSSPGSVSFAPRVDFPSAYETIGIAIADFDGDARPDLALTNVGFSGANPVVSVYRNTGKDGSISFDPRVDLAIGDIAFDIHSDDLDGDGKPDIAVSSSSMLYIFRNTSAAGAIAFDPPKSFLGNLSTEFFTVGDLDGDGRPDLIEGGRPFIQIGKGPRLSVLKNNSNPGTISFAPMIDFPGVTDEPLDVIAGQLDGDGKTDIVVVGDTKAIYLYKNEGAAGTISLPEEIGYSTKLTYNWVYQAVIGDLDGDGKPDIAVASGADNQVSIFRNQEGEHTLTVCASSGISLVSDSTGSLYQWQMNSGNGFANLSDNSLYHGSASPVLQLTAIPDSLNLRQFRCLTNGNSGLITGSITNLIVNPVIAPAGTASSPAQVCVNDPYNVIFTETGSVPLNSGIELWASNNNGPYAKLSSQAYQGAPATFPLKYSAERTENYFFTITPPATALCAKNAHSDTVATWTRQLVTPVISPNSNTITAANTDAGASYTWQLQASNGNWNDIVPAATGTTYTTWLSGNYRVKGVEGPCTVYSNAQILTVTGIVPVAANSLGIGLYPNPTTGTLILDSLNLSDGWLTLKIMSTDGRQVMEPVPIGDQSRVSISVGQLENGLYFALLTRKRGIPAIIKFLKL
ncbi:MAG TPA: FG-GAP-like repeat-containing protein [Puia sp.]|nr:FG-GAP-like repeat-containing protein [Puia sp.]